MNNRYIKKLNLLIIFIISFILLLSFNVFADYHCYTCDKDYEGTAHINEEKGWLECPLKHNIYANPNDELIIDQDKKDKLDQSINNQNSLSDEELLKDNKMFYDMMKSIFSLDNFDSQEVDLFNIKTTMGAITEALLNGINEWSNSPLYKIFVGIGVFLLFISFFVNFFSKSVNNENVTPEQLTRMILELIVATFIIANVKNIANIIVGIFIFTANQAWTLIKDGNGEGFEQQIKDITIYLLKEAGLHKKDVLDIFTHFAKGAWLNMHYFIPYMASIIGKFGLLFAVIKAEYNIFINIMLYPIAAFDCFDDIKHSNFMKYTKNIASSSLQLTIIVLVIYANNMLLSNYMNDMLANLNQHNNIFNLAVMSVVFQLVRMTMATSVADGISKQVFGG